MTCGIYRITNKVNGKFYIGLSRNIERRWRQHQWGLNREDALEHGCLILRRAFLKYNILENPERFKFEVIEKCDESQLLERETYWIDELRPDYNSKPTDPPKAPKNKTEQGCWVQYHNCDRLGYIPAESPYHLTEEDYEYALSGVSTGKKAILNAKGDIVFLIAGVGNPKQYYLISRFLIEDVEAREEADPYEKGAMFYDGYGTGWVLHPPQLLNSSEFFEFRDHCGKFGFGFMSLKEHSYRRTLNSIANEYKSEKLTYVEYIRSFYATVVANNPTERWALAGKGVSQNLVLSTSAPWAVIVLEEGATRLVVVDPNEHLINYRGLLFIHIVKEEIKDEVLKRAYSGFLKRAGIDGDQLTKEAIQGCVKVINAFKYTPEVFAAEADKHTQGKNLEDYKIAKDAPDGEVWGFEIEAPTWLDEPVSCKTPKNIVKGDYWFPVAESKVKALKVALDKFFTSSPDLTEL